MLSIIISSYQPHFYNALEKNIAETCGIPHEIIKIENPGLMGICQAYNKGARKVKFNNLLFLHEDILFQTQNWGAKLLAHLETENVGIVGIAGGLYVPAVPGGWFTTFDYALINIIQRKRDGMREVIRTFQEQVREAKALDGVFLCMKRETFRRYRFDGKMHGYHGYDTEISLRIGKKLQNFVISDILIEHFSEGHPNQKWFKENIYIRKKLGSHFGHPINKHLEFQLYKNFVEQYIEYYPKNYRNLLRVLRFFPIFKIGGRKYIPLLKFTFSIFS